MRRNKKRAALYTLAISIALAFSFSLKALAFNGNFPPLSFLTEELRDIYYPYKVQDYTLIDEPLASRGWVGVFQGDNGDSAQQSSINGSFVSMYRNYQSSLHLKNNIYLQLEISAPTDIAWLSFYLSPTEGFEDYFYVDLTPRLKPGINSIVLNRSDFSLGHGAPSWEDISVIQLAFESKEASTASVKISTIATHSSKPMLTLWFDDGWESTYSEALPRMREKNIEGVVSVIGSLVDDYGYCSLKQLKSLENSGWELVNHTYRHPDLVELSLEVAETEISMGQEYLLRNGFISGSHYFVPPYTSVNSEINDIISKYSILNRKRPSAYNAIPVLDLSDIAFREVTNVTDVETVKAWIDEAIAMELWLVLLFHRLEDTTEWTTQYTPEDFQQILNYIAEKGDLIEPVTITEAISMM